MAWRQDYTQMLQSWRQAIRILYEWSSTDNSLYPGTALYLCEDEKIRKLFPPIPYKSSSRGCSAGKLHYSLNHPVAANLLSAQRSQTEQEAKSIFQPASGGYLRSTQILIRVRLMQTCVTPEPYTTPSFFISQRFSRAPGKSDSHCRRSSSLVQKKKRIQIRIYCPNVVRAPASRG